VWTHDEHFRSLPGVHFVEAPRGTERCVRTSDTLSSLRGTAREDSPPDTSGPPRCAAGRRVFRRTRRLARDKWFLAIWLLGGGVVLDEGYIGGKRPALEGR